MPGGTTGAQLVGKSLSPHGKCRPPEPGSFIPPTSLGPLRSLPEEAGHRPMRPEKNSSRDSGQNGHQGLASPGQALRACPLADGQRL